MNDILLPETLDEHQGAVFLLATVTAWNSTGVKLLFDGQSSASQKRYRVMQTGASINIGDRVIVMKHSGTYVVLGAVKSGHGIFSTSTLGDVLTNSSLFSWTSGTFARCGNIASLYVNGDWAETKSTSAEYIAFTMKEGYRPYVTSAARAWRNVNAILYYNGNMSYYGTFDSGDGITFLCTYLLS